ncbi:Phage tail length tape-measure protein 1 [Pseudomonas sp. R2-37-08W]|uniref:phage tail tape measure protein n=1 Tax=Pseudomonas sp. R2-37-08W TaxID=1173273 RepID=UPI000F582B32|nr:phage tail tape measure protein [Pseudomonas sp. R2-37-08W]AZF09567.1 Phage tail length tape-measure protein 1 [Pseudomonas sp. R2-37-08W]
MATRSLGTLTLDLIARIGGFEQGMDKAGRLTEKRMKEMEARAEAAGKKIGGALATVVTATLGVGTASLVMLKNTAAATTETDRWAKSLGIGTTVLQQWQYAAERAGLSGDKMADIFKDIGDKIGDAVITGGGEAIDGLNKLGLSAEELARMSPDKQLLAIADGLGKVATQSEKINILESLGNDLSRMLPLLDQGGESLRKYLAQAKDFGIAMDPAQIASLVRANEVIQDLQFQVEGLRNEFVSGLANVDMSPLQNSLDGLRDIVKDPAFQQGMADLAALVVKLTGAAASGLAQLPNDLRAMANDLKQVTSFFSTDRKTRHFAGVSDEEATNRSLDAYNKSQGALNKFTTNPTLFVGDLFGQDLGAAKKASDERLASFKAYTELRGWGDQKLVEGNKQVEQQEQKVAESFKGTTAASLKLLDSYDRLNKLQQDRAALVAAMAKDPDNADRYRRAIEAIDKQVAQLNGTTKSATEAQSKLKAQLKEAATAFDQLRQTYDPVNAAAHEFSKQTGQIALLEKNGKISKEQYGKATAWLASQFNEAVNSATGLSQAMQFQADLERQLSNQREQYAAQAAAVGMGSKESDRYLERLELERQTNDKVLSLRTELATATTDTQRKALQDQIDLTNAYLPKQVAAMQEGWAQMDSAHSDWSNGAKSAWQDYLDSAKDVAGQTKSMFSNAFSSMEDSLVNFALTGKASFADFTKSILADMARIATRQASSALLGSLVGAAASYFGGSAAGGNGMAAGSAGAVSSNLGASSAGYSSTYFPQAKGGAWSGGVQMFADGGAFTNSVVSKPTAFGMAGGMGLMGEAGPEAIMPLTRTSSGALGVRAVGGGSGGAVVPTQINVTVTVASDGTTSSTADDSAYQQFGKDLGDFVDQRYRQLIRKDLAQGGSIKRAISG